ncbi:hypothetical protein, partial [Desulfovibrio piger]|uniref:hypothetical protein n=1 Tax=Desulfovibrio piger TaxID=901 RepID=UPI0019806D62
ENLFVSWDEITTPFKIKKHAGHPLKRLFRILSNFYRNFLTKNISWRFLLRKKHIPASSKETGTVPHTPCMYGFFLAQPRQEDVSIHSRPVRLLTPKPTDRATVD